MTMGLQARPAAPIVLILWHILKNGNEKIERIKSDVSPIEGVTGYPTAKHGLITHFQCADIACFVEG